MKSNNGAHRLRDAPVPANGAPTTMGAAKEPAWLLVVGLGFLAGIALGLGLYAVFVSGAAG